VGFMYRMHVISRRLLCKEALLPLLLRPDEGRWVAAAAAAAAAELSRCGT
jgi:hypothetical protein